MAKSQTGKWVSRVASTGGGRTYRAQRPTNYYAALAIIIVVGLASVFWARSSYQTQAATPTTTPATAPLVGTTTYAALAFDVCGSLEPSLAASPSAATASLTAQADGVIKIAPKNAASAGKNATVVLFASGYPGLSISTGSLKIPANGATPAVSLSNGDKCPAGTPNAGKAGTVAVTYWTNFASTTPQTSTDPTSSHFTGNSLMTVSFVPQGTKILKPSKDTISKMLTAAQASSTTPTSAPVSVPQTVPATIPPATTTTTQKK